MPTPGFSIADIQAPPEGAHFYEINSTRVTFSEYFYDATNPISFLILLFIVPFIKLFRIRLPATSTDDIPAESLDPFIVAYDRFPLDVWEKLSPDVDELGALGFKIIEYHVVRDPNHQTDTYLISLFGPRNMTARVHYRVWSHVRPPKQKLFIEFVTRLENNNYVWSTSGWQDMKVPPNCIVVTKPGASAADLMKAHETAVEEQHQTIRGLYTPEQGLDLLNWRHGVVRDFHLDRHVFRQPRGFEYKHREVAPALEQMSPTESRYQHILVEIYRLQSAKVNWKNTLGLLLLTGFLFYAVGRNGGWQPGDILYILPILLFHELGHFLAMKMFGYRNLSMFFVPGFGAAVRGKHYNLAGWKRAVVSLAGPVPGIVVGCGLGTYGLIQGQTTLVHIAALALLINGYNLLPVFPLDGGHVLRTIVFSRHYVLDVLFRVFGGIFLALTGYFLGGGTTSALGIALLLGIPLAIFYGRIVQELRQEHPDAPSADAQTIPPQIADQIIEKLSGRVRSSTSNKVMAQRTITIYEELNAQPPGWIASFFLLSTHMNAFIIAFVGVCIFVLGENPTVHRYISAFRDMIDQPKHVIATTAQPDTPQQAGGSTYQFAGPEHEQTVISSFPSESTAAAQVSKVVGTVGTNVIVREYADTLFVTFPAEPKSAAEGLVTTLSPVTKEVFIQNSAQSTRVRLYALLPTAEKADAIRAELKEYFAAMRADPHAVPPWHLSPWLDAPKYATARHARATLVLMRKAAAVAAGNPALNSPADAGIDALRRGAGAPAQGAMAQPNDSQEKMIRSRLDEFATMPESKVDRELVATILAKPAKASHPVTSLENLPPAAAQRLGVIPESAWSTPEAATTAKTGMVMVTNENAMMINATFPACEQALPALAHWLKEKGCLQLRYGLSAAPNGSPGDVFEELFSE